MEAHILIIDDDTSLVESLTAALSPPHFVHAVSNGSAALAFLARDRTHLILLDVQLGSEDGLELIPRLRELTPAPILVLTGFGTRENLLRSIRAKPDDFLDKPVGLRELRSRVVALLRGAATQEDPLEQARAWIAREFHRQITITAVAHAAGLSPAHFRRAFAERFGLSPRAYLEECRMTRAATLLRDTEQLIKEVASQVGFTDPNNFSTAFKHFHGESPDTFRSRHRPESSR